MDEPTVRFTCTLAEAKDIRDGLAAYRNAVLEGLKAKEPGSLQPVLRGPHRTAADAKARRLLALMNKMGDV